MLTRIFGVADVEGLLGQHIAAPPMTKLLARGAGDVVNTDDLPLLELRFAQSVGQHSGRDLRLDLLEIAHERGMARPALAPLSSAGAAGVVDWARVDAARFRLLARAGLRLPNLELVGAVPEWQRAFINGTPEDALALAPPLDALLDASGAPIDVGELFVWALLRASVAQDPAQRAALEPALLLLAQQGLATDAALLRLHAALVDGRSEEVVPLTRAAVALVRADPWAFEHLVLRVLQRVAAVRPPVALLDVIAELAPPFAMDSYAGPKRSALTALLLALPPELPLPGACVDVFAPLEPYPTWSRDSLALRARCYATYPAPAAAHAVDAQPIDGAELAARAVADLAAFDAHAARTFTIPP
jgi:hypothetical protein